MAGRVEDLPRCEVCREIIPMMHLATLNTIARMSVDRKIMKKVKLTASIIGDEYS